MHNPKTEDDVTYSIPPPSDKIFEIKNKSLLIWEVFWFILQIPLYIMIAIYREMFPSPEKSLKGQVVLVTGAGRGLGKGLALEFAKEGCMVAVVDVNKTTAVDTAAEIVKLGGIAKAYFTNVAKVEEVKELQAAVDKDFGFVDILVNNAALLFVESVGNQTDEEIRAVIAVNLTSHFWMVREFLPAMKERNSGHIVAISSLCSFFGGANASAYVATKYGVRGFMECVRAELEENPTNNIKTTTVFPYFINTSSHYIDHWEMRCPPLSIEEAVKTILAGVKRDKICLPVPRSYHTLVQCAWMIPQDLIDKAMKIVSIRVFPLSKEEKQRSLTTCIVKELASKEKHSF